ncbi:MAG: D-sedoheptulose 7-phosphate isomerase [Deltaproteobacteria bacterium]|nr:D-sedoheptulose 7-phosphate isomerase [Deltaproteobacteria bacterium]
MEDYIVRSAQESIKVVDAFFRDNTKDVAKAINVIVAALKAGNKVMFCGNGGSAADAQHLTAEFVNRFQIERPPLPAIALSTDSSVLTSIGNDYSFDDIFSKQIRALGKDGDILVAISTSGASANILKALEQAKRQKMFSIAFLGKDGGAARQLADLSLVVPANSTPRIQEAHILLGHIICEMIDMRLFQNPYEK